MRTYCKALSDLSKKFIALKTTGRLLKTCRRDEQQVSLRHGFEPQSSLSDFFEKPLRLSMCLFVLLCLSSVGYASPPSADVHFCRVLDFEDMRERDSIYAATKQAFDLNVGEPRTVRMIYFLPNDRPFRQEVVDSMKVTIRQIQTFYAEQMQAHGYENKTFRFETDAQGEPLIHRMDGQHPDSHYLDDTIDTVFDEIERMFDLDANIYFIVIDNSISAIVQGGWLVSGVGGRRGKNGGDTLFPGEFSFKTAAHELGHAFGLQHDFNDDAYMMSYGTHPDQLSACNTEFLAVHPYFDLDIPIEEAQLPTIELLSPKEYPAGSKSISIQLKISDLEGLHQVLLFVTTSVPHPAAGFVEVKACRGLAGEKDAVIEFEYNGVIPSLGYTSLSDPIFHPIYIEVVDIDGNVIGVPFDLVEISSYYIATLEGHTNRVHSVSFSPDGTMLASGAEDHTIKLWTVAEKTNIATLEGHTDRVRSVSFSPDGTILASGSHDQTVRLWDVSTKRNIAILEEQKDRISSVAFSPDGTTLASGAWDATVRLWDVATRRNIAVFEHTDIIAFVSFSPDGATLASGLDDGTVTLWDVATRTNIATLREHGDNVTSIAFSPDGATLAVGAGSAIKLWDISREENIATLEGHRGQVTSVVFSPDGRTLASGAYDQTTRLWDVLTRTNIATFREDMLDVASVAFSPDGVILASGTGDGKIGLWDTSEWTQPRPQTLVKISGDNQQSATGTELANPFIVEVRDQYGNPLQGAQVTFTITTGNGKLSGRFTVENVTTDVSGRVERTLTPGQGTNTVEVSVADIEATFNAVGAGIPATPVIGGDYPTWHLPDGAMIRLGKGHMGKGDRAVAFSPDGRSLAVASGIGVWLYDVGISRERALLVGHRDEVTSVAFSLNGMTLASGSRDGEVKLWDVDTGENIATLERHRSGVTSVAFSSNGTTLASGSYDRTIKLWDVRTRENIATLEGHTNFVTSVAFSPDGQILASGSWDETARLWDVATRENIATFGGYNRTVYSVAFSSDGTILASGSQDGIVQMWDVATEQNIAAYRHIDDSGMKQWISSIAFSPNGATFAVGLNDNTVKLWDVATGINIATLEGHTDWVYSVTFSPIGTTLASGSDDGTVKLWDMATQNVSTLTEHLSVVRSIALSPNGAILASGSNGEVALWDVATGRQIATLEKSTGSGQTVVFSPDGKMLATNSLDGIKLWDVETGQTIVTLKHRGSIHSVVFSPDGTMLVAGTYDKVRLWNIMTGENIADLEGHMSEVRSVAFSPDGKMLASGSFDNTIRLWDVGTGQNIATLPHNIWVNSISFSPDGTTLAGSDDKTIRLWDVETRETIATFGGYTSPVISISFSPDGTTLAGSDDKTIRLWDVATERSIATFEGHINTVTAMAFSSYGTTLASGSGDGTILLWDVSQYITPVVYMPDANLRAVIRDALGKSRFAPITTTDMASLTTLDASNRNIRDLTGLESATNLTELNLVDNRLSSLSINTHIPALQDRGVEVLFDKTPTPDFDGDGTVGFADFLLFVAQFGFSEDDEGYDVWFDLDGDGTIGFGDFLIFANAFGKVVSSN